MTQHLVLEVPPAGMVATGDQRIDPATLLKALADPMRLRIVRLLAQYGALNVSAITEHVHIQQPTVSHHLRILRFTRMVQCIREGTWNYYSLCPETLQVAQRIITELQALYAVRQEEYDEHVEK